MQTNGQVQTIEDRLAARGPRGEHLSLLTGQETLEELRYLIIQLSTRCRDQPNQPQCPFRLLSSLSYAAMTSMVKDLPRITCLDLFQMELECRSQPDSACSLICKNGPGYPSSLPTINRNEPGQ